MPWESLDETPEFWTAPDENRISVPVGIWANLIPFFRGLGSRPSFMNRISHNEAFLRNEGEWGELQLIVISYSIPFVN